MATSLTLTARGVPHIVVEAQTEPVRKPGEALPPNAKPLLRQLGIEYLLQHEAHLPYYGNQSAWKGTALSEENFLKDVHGNGFLLDRLHFEKQLREVIQAPLLTGYRLQSVSRSDSGVKLHVENDHKRLDMEARYIVDATGRKASVCRHLDIHQTSVDDWFALWFHIKGKAPAQIFIESTSLGWWYVAPFGKEELTVMFFTRKPHLPQQTGRLLHLQEQFKEANELNRMFSLSPLSSSAIRIRPCGTSCLDIPYGDAWVAVGDAAYAYDPISSFGITSALAGGYYAGNALADTLEGNPNALPVYRYIMENAFQAYLKKLETLYV